MGANTAERAPITTFIFHKIPTINTAFFHIFPNELYSLFCSYDNLLVNYEAALKRKKELEEQINRYQSNLECC